jgi:bla regulator protein BlaR1
MQVLKKVWFIGCWLAIVLPARGAATSSERDLSAFFGKYTGAFVMLDAASNHFTRYQPELCAKRLTPCSTFKIANSLIALETDVASSLEFRLPWDGAKQPFEAWNRDQTMRSAFAVSCLWYYQELARRAGIERMDQFLKAIPYGNQDTSGGITNFWLSSSLKISADEQVEFLQRLHALKLPFSNKTMAAVLELMVVGRRDDLVYRGKTGTAGDPVAKVATLGWWVGSVTKPEGNYYFATQLTGGENPSGATARKITEAILADMEILPAPKP